MNLLCVKLNAIGMQVLDSDMYVNFLGRWMVRVRLWIEQTAYHWHIHADHIDFYRFSDEPHTDYLLRKQNLLWDVFDKYLKSKSFTEINKAMQTCKVTN